MVRFEKLLRKDHLVSKIQQKRGGGRQEPCQLQKEWKMRGNMIVHKPLEMELISIQSTTLFILSLILRNGHIGIFS